MVHEEESTMNSKDDCEHDAATPTLPPLAVADVPFPYAEPYQQQVQLMQAVLDGLDGNKKAGDAVATRNSRTHVLMLESPTGTGKSLSLACSTIAWLKRQEEIDCQRCSAADLLPHTGTAVRQHASSGLNMNTPVPARQLATTADVPTDIEETGQLQANGDSTLQNAVKARRDLDRALIRIRQPLQLAYEHDGYDEIKRADVIQQQRIHGLRSAIRSQTSPHLQKKRRRDAKSSSKQRTDIKEVDFCLPEYSDGIGASADTNRIGLGMFGGRDFDLDDDDSESDDDASDDHYDSAKENSKRNGNGAKGATKIISKMNSNQRGTETDVPADKPGLLLNANRLAGSLLVGTSNATTRKQFGVKASSSKQAKANAASQSGNGVRKILYAARTHSQLSQFLAEVRKTHWGKSLRAIALGSRSTAGVCGYLAMDPKFKGKSKKNDADWTETCLDLQKSTSKSNVKRSSSSSSSGCPYKSDADAVSTLALHLLTQPTDIEETARLGQAVQTCAYYASREAIAAAELIVLPYSMLVSKETRQSLQLSLKDNVVIIDEAHNLSEIMTNMFGAALSITVVQAANQQLQKYVQKYLRRLGSRNLHYLRQLAMICQNILKHFKKAKQRQAKATAAASTRSSNLIPTSQLMIELKLANINLYPLLRYMKESRLSQKLLGFMNHERSVDTQQQHQSVGDLHSNSSLSKHVSPMSVLETFLVKLSQTSRHGKILLDYGTASQIRYVLLHPSEYCQDLLEQPHALCLVGGTLRPFGHVASELFGSLGNTTMSAGNDRQDNHDLIDAAGAADRFFQTTPSTPSCVANDAAPVLHQGRFTAFSCSHVVSPSNVLLQAIGKVNSTVLDFRHKQRSTPAVCRALGMALLRICRNIPNGVVVFLPSYKYESELIEFWKREQGGVIWKDLRSIKRVFQEPKSSSDVEKVLRGFGDAALDGCGNGALLFSVVGGKLSEGINFANELGRGVVIVGLPYADITDPILQEKMKLLDEQRDGGGNALSSQAYYHNLCMRAVNQSVGRAIRHANDHAAIVLLDQRYQTDSRVAKQLPQWLTSSGNQWRDSTMNETVERLRSFFTRMKMRK